MLQLSPKQLLRDKGRSSMRLAWTQPCSQQAWVGSPKLQGEHGQEQGANLAIVHRINSNNSAALAVPPSQRSAMPRSSCNGQIYISAGVHSSKNETTPNSPFFDFQEEISR